MAITVLEATRLDTFKKFRLIAGHRGLDNMIEKIGILDYEFVTKKEGNFGRNEFVITSLLFAKDDPNLIFDAVKELEQNEVSGLAIKNIYYNDLPSKIVDYANENSFPIFIFKEVFFEDIITEIMNRIRFIDNYEILETKVDILIRKSLNKTTVRELAYEINSSFKEHFFAVYCKDKKYVGSNETIALIERLKRNKSIDIYTSIIKYRDGFLILCTYEKFNEKDMDNKINSLIDNIRINKDDYYIGISNLHFSLGELDNGINESIFAQRAGELSNSCFSYFNDIGVYSILMPYLDEVWLKSFYSRVLTPIKNYDEKYNGEMLYTAVKYIENDGKIDETAKELFLHKNTIRYRINKIKEMLDMGKSEGSFYEQLSIAIKLHKIYNM